jgi:hypothetical protein
VSVGAPRGEGGRRLLLAALAAVAVASLAVLAAAAMRGGEGEAVAGGLYEELRSLRSTLDLMIIEYREAVRDGRVVLESEYGVALQLARKALEIYGGVRAEIERVDPDAAEELGRLLESIASMVESAEDPDAVESEVRRAIEIVERLMEAAG